MLGTQREKQLLHFLKQNKTKNNKYKTNPKPTYQHTHQARSNCNR